MSSEKGGVFGVVFYKIQSNPTLPGISNVKRVCLISRMTITVAYSAICDKTGELDAKTEEIRR